jgi:hypothetical protein
LTEQLPLIVVHFSALADASEDFEDTSGGRGMRNRFARVIRRLPSAEQSKAAGVVYFAFGMAAVGGEFVVSGGHFEVLLDAAAVLEAEPEIVCAVRVALLGGAPIEAGGKREIFVSADAALQANAKAVLGGGVFFSEDSR